MTQQFNVFEIVPRCQWRTSLEDSSAIYDCRCLLAEGHEEEHFTQDPWASCISLANRCCDIHPSGIVCLRKAGHTGLHHCVAGNSDELLSEELVCFRFTTLEVTSKEEEECWRQRAILMGLVWDWALHNKDEIQVYRESQRDSQRSVKQQCFVLLLVIFVAVVTLTTALLKKCC